LSFAAASIGQIGFVYSTLEELLLLSSPASARNGWPSTISWVAVPCFRKWGMSAAPALRAGVVLT
jgi:hypothetical protein